MKQKPTKQGAGNTAPKSDTKQRQSKRMARLNSLAIAAGWTGISEYLTAFLSGRIDMENKKCTQ